jgi:hypothetical protein
MSEIDLNAEARRLGVNVRFPPATAAGAAAAQREAERQEAERHDAPMLPAEDGGNGGAQVSARPRLVVSLRCLPAGFSDLRKGRLSLVCAVRPIRLTRWPLVLRQAVSVGGALAAHAGFGEGASGAPKPTPLLVPAHIDRTALKAKTLAMVNAATSRPFRLPVLEAAWEIGLAVGFGDGGDKLQVANASVRKCYYMMRDLAYAEACMPNPWEKADRKPQLSGEKRQHPEVGGRILEARIVLSSWPVDAIVYADDVLCRTLEVVVSFAFVTSAPDAAGRGGR